MLCRLPSPAPASQKHAQNLCQTALKNSLLCSHKPLCSPSLVLSLIRSSTTETYSSLQRPQKISLLSSSSARIPAKYIQPASQKAPALCHRNTASTLSLESPLVTSQSLHPKGHLLPVNESPLTEKYTLLTNGQNISMPRVKLSLVPQFHYLIL